MLYYNSITTVLSYNTVLFLFLSLSIFCFSSTTSSIVKSFPIHHASNSKNEYARSMLHGSTSRFLADEKDGYGGMSRRNLVEQATNSNLTLLASQATTRRDPLNHFVLYRGGWNVTDKHYWASVGFTAAPLFAISVIWFVIFGLSLFCMCICCCCCRRDTKDYKSGVYKISIVFLILLFLAAIAGSIALYLGQGKLQNSMDNTLNYILDQVKTTVNNLIQVGQYLLDARNINVVTSVLPDDVLKTIDRMEQTLNVTSSAFGNQTQHFSDSTEKVLGQVGLSLVLVAAFILTITLLGLVFSALGWECPVYTLVILGWILVTFLFILGGVFLLFHNAIGDTCIAMNEWVEHPVGHTAIDQIIPCMDKKNAEQILKVTDGVTYSLVSLVNGVISNISNSDIPSDIGPPFYINQTGPAVPLLCNPFNSDLSTRECASSEVNLTNSVTVWKEYTCEVSSDGICKTQGRLTPSSYRQNIAAVNVSFGLYHYGPFLVSLGDCTFIRQTLSDVTTDYCPGLVKYTKWVYIGSVLLAASGLFSVIFWTILTRQGKRRSTSKNNRF